MSSTTIFGLLCLCMLAAFVAALFSPRWWAVAAFVGLPFLLNGVPREEPPNFDGPGVGLEVAVFFACVNVFLWLLGRWIRGRVRQVP